VKTWTSDHPIQQAKATALRSDIQSLAKHVDAGALQASTPWDALHDWAETALTAEGKELVVSLMIEPHGALVDDLADTMAVDESAAFHINGAMSVAELSQAMQAQYAWSQRVDFCDQAQSARFWYVSQSKLEPRLGERHQEPGADLEQRKRHRNSRLPIFWLSGPIFAISCGAFNSPALRPMAKFRTI